MIETLGKTDPWAKMLKAGLILWRHCSITSEGVSLQEFAMEMTNRGSLLAKLNLCPVSLWEPEVIPNKIGDIYTKGIALFVDQMPPPHWTHLVITGLGKAFSQPGNPEKGGCLFAKVAIPYELSDYIKFRGAMLEQTTATTTIERAVEMSKQFCPIEKRDCEYRLIVQPAWTETDYFRFKII